MEQALVVAICAAFASFLSGLLGIGGALVLTPLLLYVPPLAGVEELPVKLVTGLTIVQAVSGSLFGALRHRGYGNVSMRTLRVMGPAIAAAALAGALVSRDTPDRVLLLVFAVLAVVGALGLLAPHELRSGPVDERHVNIPVALAVALALGFFGGMVGIAGVWLILPALIHLLHLAPRVAMGTSLGVGVFGALAAFAGKAATAQIDPLLGGLVFATGLLVAPLGVVLSMRVRPRTLTTVLALVVLLAAARIAWSGVSGG